MSNSYFVIISLVAILGIGGIGMILSLDYTASNSNSEIKDITLQKENIPIKDAITIKDTITTVKSSNNHKIAVQLVNIIIKTYEKENQQISALDKKLGFKVSQFGLRYGFVIDGNDLIVAHFNPDRIGETAFIFENSVESKELIKNKLQTDGEIWVHYSFENPETGEIEPKTSYLKLHDGLVFGSGFYN